MDGCEIDKFDAELRAVHAGMQARIIGGRNVAAGNMRGCQLEFGKMREYIGQDADFQQALALAKYSGSICTLPKLMNLFLIIKYGFAENPASGDIIEFGSYRGGTAIFMAYLAKRFRPGIHVWALDTYCGMPDTNATVDVHKRGDFGDSGLDNFHDKIKECGLDNITPVKGLFIDTYPGVMKKICSIVLSHVDCDIYDSVFYATCASMLKMMHGGYIIYDDPLHGSCLGALQAVEDTLGRIRLHAEQAYPHLVYRYPPLKG